jgi:hypothetical protein
MIFFPLGMILKQLSLEAASWHIFNVFKKTHAEILSQNGMHTAGRTAATAGYS